MAGGFGAIGGCLAEAWGYLGTTGGYFGGIFVFYWIFEEARADPIFGFCKIVLLDL